MKYISSSILNVNDLGSLASIEKPHDSYKHLKVVYENKEELEKSYINYIFFAKNYRLLDIPRNSIIKNIGKESFVEHYDNPKSFSEFITDYRLKNRSNFCYMCGNLNAGTLDHLLPKDIYPEFSFFSKNLIPSCDCNSKKKIDLSSALNPHFYKECDSELYFLDINIISLMPQIDFEFEIKVINTMPKMRIILENHLKNHLLKYSDIINYMKNHISEILNNPLAAFSIYKQINRIEVKERIEILVNVTKFQSKSENRWDVILYKGFLKEDLIDFIELEVNKQFP